MTWTLPHHRRLHLHLDDHLQEKLHEKPGLRRDFRPPSAWRRSKKIVPSQFDSLSYRLNERIGAAMSRYGLIRPTTLTTLLDLLTTRLTDVTSTLTSASIGVSIEQKRNWRMMTLTLSLLTTATICLTRLTTSWATGSGHSDDRVIAFPVTLSRPKNITPTVTLNSSHSATSSGVYGPS